MQYFKYYFNGLLFLLMGLLGFETTAHAAIVVIGNPSIQISSLNKNQVASLYLGKPIQLSTREQLKPYDQVSSSPSYKMFYKEMMGWDGSQVNGYWSSLVFSGDASQPSSVSGDATAIQMVKSIPNSIAYVDSSSLQNHNGEVKVLYEDYQPPVVMTSNTNTISNNSNNNSRRSGYHSMYQNSNSSSPQTPPSNDNLTTQNPDPAVQAQGLNISNQAIGTVWEAIQAELDVTADTNNPQVRHEIINFLSNPKELNYILQNSAPYIYYVFQQTKQRHMPAMFALLPLLESGYSPYSYSRTGASGLWQMMPGTASSYGLNIDWWYDARRDILISTNAALNYLVELNRTFHDWELAAAAYDAGDGTVSNAISFNRRTGRDTSFWSLPLPQETREYVPKLLALAAIIKNPQQFGVQLPNVPNKPFFVAFKMDSQLSLEEIAKLANMPLASVQRLNPGIRRLSTNPTGEYLLLIPADNANYFRNNLAHAAGQKHMNWQYHEVHKGETLDSIAKNYHVNADQIVKANSLNTALLPGQGILVPIWLNKTFKNPIGIITDLTYSDHSLIAQQKNSVQMAGAPGIPSVQTVSADNNPTPGSMPIPVENGLSNTPQTQLVVQQQPVQDPNVINSNDSLKSIVAKLYGSD